MNRGVENKICCLGTWPDICANSWFILLIAVHSVIKTRTIKCIVPNTSVLVTCFDREAICQSKSWMLGGIFFLKVILSVITLHSSLTYLPRHCLRRTYLNTDSYQANVITEDVFALFSVPVNNGFRQEMSGRTTLVLWLIFSVYPRGVMHVS